MSETILNPSDVKGVWTLLVYLIQHPKRILSAGLHLLVLALIILTIATAIAWAALSYRGIDPIVFIQSQTKTPMVGLVDYSRSSDQQDSFKWSRLRSAKKEVFFLGVTMHITLGQDHLEDLRSNLKRGISHRFLIADPTGRHFASNCAMFSGDDGDHRKQALTTIRGYRRLREEIASNPDTRNGTIELRIIDAPFPQAGYFFDASESDATLILVTRLPNVGAPSMPALVFGKAPNGLLDSYYTEWNRVWAQGVPLEMWLKNHQEIDAVTISK